MISIHDVQFEIIIIITLLINTPVVKKQIGKIVLFDWLFFLINFKGLILYNVNSVSEENSMIFCSRDCSASGIII